MTARNRVEISRRAVMKGAAALLVAPGFVPRSASAVTQGAGVDWYVTTAASPWQKRELAAAPGGAADVFVQTDTPPDDRGLRRLLQRARLDVARDALGDRAGRRAARAVRARRGRRLHAVPHAGRRERLLAQLVLV